MAQSVAKRLRATYAESLSDPVIYASPAPTKVSANGVTDDFTVPDFCALYPGSSALPARLAYLLWNNATYLADVFVEDGLYKEVLPPDAIHYVSATAKESSNQWLERFAVSFLRIADAVARAQIPTPRCTAEEMALHIVVEFVSGDIQDIDYLFGDDADFAALPPVADLAVGLENVLDWLSDADVLMTFSIPAVSLEELDMDAVNLVPKKWFLPFQP